MRRWRDRAQAGQRRPPATPDSYTLQNSADMGTYNELLKLVNGPHAALFYQ
jgi:hypothetical protein